jgi:acetate kinase
MIFLYLITPLLGTLRNYIKYKRIKILLFLRTPITYFMINLIFQNQNIWKTLMFERWFFFIYKSLLSLYNDDYNVKKQKYIKKYGLKY